MVKVFSSYMGMYQKVLLYGMQKYLVVRMVYNALPYFTASHGETVYTLEYDALH